MANFCQFLMILIEFINIGLVYIRGGLEGLWSRVGGGKSLNKEVRGHK